MMRVQVDTREFSAAMRQYLVVTKKELSAAINDSMFFVLLRLYVLLPPTRLMEKRQQVRDFLNEPVVGTRTHKGKRRLSQIRVFSRVHKLVQYFEKQAGRKGLYGAEMRKAAGKFRKKRIGSVGYLKSVVVKAIRKISPSFTQYGTWVQTGKQIAGGGFSQRRPRQWNGVNLEWKQKREVKANAALMKITAEYGAFAGNVAVMKGAQTTVKMATPGLNPQGLVAMDLGLANDIPGSRGSNISKVTTIFNPALQRAFDDECKEKLQHVAARMQEISNQFSG